MKKTLVIALAALAWSVGASEFIHPMDFKNSEAEKNQVIAYIKQQVRKDYCEGELDMCDNVTLRMMEAENLSAFKKATQAKDRDIMDKVISDYCEGDLDMCNYSTIYMMYQENVKAGSQSLEW
ncbi:hypothetical protein [Rheinheimera sp.]|uniref:hypothetical protein n=1 Tax=Rheinheimera sp. TaxID=1869214 RepID=UPI00307F7DD6